MGTPSYMAPEQARGEIDRLDERCDVFALGSILCEFLTGEPAFTGRSSGEIQRKASRGDLKEAIDRLDSSGADAELIALAKDCLAPEIEDRPRHAGEVAGRINAYQSGVQERLRPAEIARAEETVRAEEAIKRVQLERSRVRLTIAWAGAMLGMIGMAVGGLFYISRMKADRRSSIERVVTEAIDKANVLRGQAQAANFGDMSKWTDAVATVHQAGVLLGAGEPDNALRDRVDGLLAVVQREQREASHRAAELDRDRTFLERLAMIELEVRTRNELSRSQKVL